MHGGGMSSTRRPGSGLAQLHALSRRGRRSYQPTPSIFSHSPSSSLSSSSFTTFFLLSFYPPLSEQTLRPAVCNTLRNLPICTTPAAIRQRYRYSV